MKKQVADKDGLIEYYLQAKAWVVRSPFSAEVRWQAELNPDRISESEFLREYAWVILNSGFREAVIRKHFDYISLCYCDWQSANEILNCEQACLDAALCAFKNIRKLQAIGITARQIGQVGFENFKDRLLENFHLSARTLPFIGPVTVLHLAKNLGIDTAKPDRHLVRVAARFGYGHVEGMCETISQRTGDKLSVADIVLWRFQEQNQPGMRGNRSNTICEPLGLV